MPPAPRAVRCCTRNGDTRPPAPRTTTSLMYHTRPRASVVESRHFGPVFGRKLGLYQQDRPGVAKIGLHPRRHARIELMAAHNLNSDKFGSLLGSQIRDHAAANDVGRF